MKCMMILAVLAASPAACEELGWVVNIGVFDREELADPLALELDSTVEAYVGILWAPDWESLADDYKGWMVYSGPYGTGDEAASAACEFLYRYPRVSAVWAGDGPARGPRPAEAATFDDVLGLMPPQLHYYETGVVPPGWQVDRTFPDVGEVEEWEQPSIVMVDLPGWAVGYIMDCYLGTVEERAIRLSSPDVDTEYAFASRFLESSAEAAGAEVVSDDGEYRYTMLHRLPDPGDREGDRDVWVLVSGDLIEYGTRTRLFYGEMPYCWPFLPEIVHASTVPDVVASGEEAIDFLVGALQMSGAYGGGFPEGLSFGIEWMDGMPDDVYRDYYDIAVREVHPVGGPGDPNVSPVVDRFRVYTRGEVIWWHPLYGEFVPFEELPGPLPD